MEELDYKRMMDPRYVDGGDDEKGASKKHQSKYCEDLIDLTERYVMLKKAAIVQAAKNAVAVDHAEANNAGNEKLDVGECKYTWNDVKFVKNLPQFALIIAIDENIVPTYNREVPDKIANCIKMTELERAEYFANYFEEMAVAEQAKADPVIKDAAEAKAKADMLYKALNDAEKAKDKPDFRSLLELRIEANQAMSVACDKQVSADFAIIDVTLAKECLEKVRNNEELDYKRIMDPRYVDGGDDEKGASKKHQSKSCDDLIALTETANIMEKVAIDQAAKAVVAVDHAEANNAGKEKLDVGEGSGLCKYTWKDVKFMENFQEFAIFIVFREKTYNGEVPDKIANCIKMTELERAEYFANYFEKIVVAEQAKADPAIKNAADAKAKADMLYKALNDAEKAKEKPDIRSLLELRIEANQAMSVACDKQVSADFAVIDVTLAKEYLEKARNHVSALKTCNSE